MNEISEILLQQFVEINLDLYTELDKSIVEPYEKVSEILRANQRYLENNPSCDEKYREKLERNNYWLRKLLETQASLINLHLRTGTTRQIIIERNFYKEENEELRKNNASLINSINKLIDKIPFLKSFLSVFVPK